MLRFLRKAGVAAVAAAAISAGTAIPAFADDVDSAQIKICNHLDHNITFYAVGYNQHEDWTTSYKVQIDKGTCYPMADWWWQVNRSIEAHQQEHFTQGWSWNPVYIQKDKAGGWETITVHYR